MAADGNGGTLEDLTDIAVRIWSEELRRRWQQHEKRMRGVSEAVAARGIGLSGTHVLLAFEASVDEIRIRARLAGAVVMRAISTSERRLDRRALRHIFSRVITNMYQDVDASLKAVLRLVRVTGDHEIAHLRNLGHEEVEAIRQQEAELDLMSMAAHSTTTGAIVVNAPNYGVVQSGQGNSANVVARFDSANLQAIREATHALS